MKAIYGHTLYVVNRHTSTGVELIRADGINNHELLFITYDTPGLILDSGSGESDECECPSCQRTGDHVV